MDISNLHSTQDYKDVAESKLDKLTFNYINGGAFAQFTKRLNQEAFNDLRFRKNYFRNVSNRDMSTTIFGSRVQMPIGISPTCCHKIASELGEIDTAKAAENLGSIYILNSVSTVSIEDVAKAAPNGVKWLQSYVYTEASTMRNLFRKAEQNGFKAIVLTLDLPVKGSSRNYYALQFQLPVGLNFPDLPPSYTNYNDTFGTLLKYISQEITPSVLKKVVSMTKLPVVAKGILTREGALLAKQAGCKGVLVSTHGGRQLDGDPASIQALPEIVRAVGRDMVVLLDSGVRGGSEVLKALALGADYVFMGRPIFYGLATAGQTGVEGVLQVVREEFDSVMALIGARTLKDINRNMVVHKSYYNHYHPSLNEPFYEEDESDLG